jgi:hypothetical protein
VGFWHILGGVGDSLLAAVEVFVNFLDVDVGFVGIFDFCVGSTDQAVGKLWYWFVPIV